MKIGIIGAGSFGIALGILLNNNGHKVTIWSRGTNEKEFNEVVETRENKSKLPGVFIPREIDFSKDWKELSFKDAISLVKLALSMKNRSLKLKLSMENIKNFEESFNRIITLSGFCLLAEFFLRVLLFFSFLSL